MTTTGVPRHCKIPQYTIHACQAVAYVHVGQISITFTDMLSY